MPSIEPMHNYFVLSFVRILTAGIRILRPSQKGLIGQLGQFRKLAEPGFHGIIPVVVESYSMGRKREDKVQVWLDKGIKVQRL